MSQSHFISSERVIGHFDAPARGVNRLLPAYQLPPDSLRDASNVIYRAGILRPRPGYSQFHSQVFSGTPTGAYPYLRGAADPVPILATTTRQYAYDGGAWSDKTGTLQTATTSQAARFTSISLGTPTVSYVIHSNGKDTPTSWSGSGTFTAAPGSPPKFTDLCTISDHIIGIVPPYGVQWSNIRSFSTWPTLNVKQAAETPDATVALRPLGQGSNGILYKERSLWGVTYTGASTEATTFRFDFIGFYDGPASAAAVVDVDGLHLYMTPTGRIALFNGSQHQWVADGLWPLIRTDIDTTKSPRVWGFYDPMNHEVHFFYPTLTYSSALRGHVCITLPKADQGIATIGSFPGYLTDELTAGSTVRLTDYKDFCLTAGTTANRSYKFTTDAATDDGTGFSGYWQTGLIQTPGRDPFKVEAVETYAERGTGYGSLTVQGIRSYTLAGEGTRMGNPQIINLAGEEPVKDGTGFDAVHGRFLGLRYAFANSSTCTLRFKGASLFAQRRSA